MLHRIKVVAVVSLLLFTTRAKAEAFSFPTLETSMTDPIFQSLAAAFAFRPNEPASDLGVRWGVYLGAGGSATSTDLVNGIITGLDSSYLPGGEAQLGIGLPKGITVQLGFIPTLNFDGSSVSKYGGALKWTLNRTVLAKKKMFPVTLALALNFSKTSLAFTQPQGGGTVAVDYSASTYGLTVLASRFLGAAGFGIEPYVGLGLYGQSSTLAATGTGNLFGSSFAAGTSSVSGSGFSFGYQAGMLLKLAALGFAAEYNNLYGVSSYGGKFSLRF